MELETEFRELKEYIDAPKVGIVNLARQQDLIESYEIIRGLVMSEDEEATVEIIEGALQLGSVFIRATTCAVTIYDTELFAEATKKADNFQVCPTLDDRVTLDVLFNGVIEYTLIEPEEAF